MKGRIKDFIVGVIIALLFTFNAVFTYNVNATTVEDTKVPILMYHSIATDEGNNWVVSEEDFEQQMKYLSENGYTTLSLDELQSFLKGKIKMPKKPLVITFDDGYSDNYTTAYPILKKYKFKATVFVITKHMDKSSAFLNSKQLKEMDENGFDIQSHTVNHDKLSSLLVEEQLKTLSESKEAIEKVLNKKVKYMAYPHGKYDKMTMECLAKTGYEMAITTDYGRATQGNNVYSLKRLMVSGSMDLEDFKKLVAFK